MARTLIPRVNWGWPLTRFESDMGDLMERFIGAREGWMAAHEAFMPHTNLAETEADYEVTVELPGMKAEDFRVEIEGGELRISGEKKDVKEEKGKSFHRIERRFGEFHRVFPLGVAVDANKVQAEYKDGVLTVRVPKAEQAKPRKIDVKT